MVLRYKCLMAYFRYEYNPRTGVWDRPRGMSYSIPRFNSTYAVDDLTPEPNGFLGTHIEYYTNLIKRLKSLGYVDGRNLVSVGFDWKEPASDKFVQDAKTIIENTYRMNRNTPVIIFAHSMGCPYSYYFLTRMGNDWVKKYVRIYVPIGPAWMGAVKALDMLISGLGNLFTGLGEYFVPLTRHLPTVWFLLPNAAAYGPNNILATSPSKKYYFKDMTRLLNDGNLSQVEGKLNAARKFFAGISDYSRVPPVPIRHIVGTGSDTTVGLRFEKDITPRQPDAIWGKYSRITGDGDSTVPLVSAMYAYNIWKSKGANIQLTQYRGLGHMDLVQDDKVINQLVGIACNGKF